MRAKAIHHGRHRVLVRASTFACLRRAGFSSSRQHRESHEMTHVNNPFAHHRMPAVIAARWISPRQPVYVPCRAAFEELAANKSRRLLLRASSAHVGAGENNSSSVHQNHAADMTYRARLDVARGSAGSPRAPEIRRHRWCGAFLGATSDMAADSSTHQGE